MRKPLDQVAAVCASRYAGRDLAALSADPVMLRQPIHAGELMMFLTSVNYAGPSSMEIGIEAIRTQEVRHIKSCFFSMVAVDEKREPAPVPALQPLPRTRNGASKPRKCRKLREAQPKRLTSGADNERTPGNTVETAC